MTVTKITTPPTQKELIDKTNEIIDNLGGGGGSSTDVQINGTSITSQGVANILTNSAYNASSNKIATMSDLSDYQLTSTAVTHTANTAVGSANQPVYVNSSGVATACNLPSIHNLFDFKWVDHELTDQSWLKADTFSWQSGTTYSNAYNHLVSDISGITAQTETIGSYTVTFYRATDGHKVCLADQEQTVLDIYNESGIAWYYILDTTNTRFKAPRTKWGFKGLRDYVGDYVEPGLPNITAGFRTGSWKTDEYGANTTGAATQTHGGNLKAYTSGTNAYSYVDTAIDASRSNSIYGNSSTVQPPATQMYLYFYVGEFTETATQQTAGLNASLFNNKADTNLLNASFQGTSYGAGWAMPSGTYDDLTLGASGTTYVAPANGWFAVCKTANGNNQIITISNISVTGESSFLPNLTSRCFVPQSGWSSACYVPAKKDDTVLVEYTVGGETNSFKFIYAQGSEWEANS